MCVSVERPEVRDPQHYMMDCHMHHAFIIGIRPPVQCHGETLGLLSWWYELWESQRCPRHCSPYCPWGHEILRMRRSQPTIKKSILAEDEAALWSASCASVSSHIPGIFAIASMIWGCTIVVNAHLFRVWYVEGWCGNKAAQQPCYFAMNKQLLRQLGMVSPMRLRLHPWHASCLETTQDKSGRKSRNIPTSVNHHTGICIMVNSTTEKYISQASPGDVSCFFTSTY